MLTIRTGERMVDIKTIAAAMEMAEAEFNAWLEKLLEGTAEENKDMWRRQFKEHLAAMVFLKQLSALGHRVACDFESPSFFGLSANAAERTSRRCSPYFVERPLIRSKRVKSADSIVAPALPLEELFTFIHLLSSISRGWTVELLKRFRGGDNAYKPVWDSLTNAGKDWVHYYVYRTIDMTEYEGSFLEFASRQVASEQ